MRTHRQRQATTVIVVLAVLLGLVWAGGLDPPATGDPAGRLKAARSMPGIEAAVLPDRAPALRPSAERPDPAGRLLALLLGLLPTALVTTFGLAGRLRRSSRAPARSPVLSAPRGPRAPPRLQPA